MLPRDEDRGVMPTAETCLVVVCRACGGTRCCSDPVYANRAGSGYETATTFRLFLVPTALAPYAPGDPAAACDCPVPPRSGLLTWDPPS